MQWNIFSGGMPPGLTFDPAAGTISGTPTIAGNFGASVSVTDGLGGHGTAALTFTVTAAPPPADYLLTISPTTFSMQVGVPFSVQLLATK